MLMESPFTHDVSGTFTDRVGRAGLDHAAFRDLMPRAGKALDRLRDSKASDGLPLLALPGRRDDVAAWRPIVDRYRALFDNVIVLGIVEAFELQRQGLRRKGRRIDIGDPPAAYGGKMVMGDGKRSGRDPPSP